MTEEVKGTAPSDNRIAPLAGPTFDASRPCPKCGSSWSKNRYRRGAIPHTPEHIERTCCGCEYVWREAPLHGR